METEMKQKDTIDISELNQIFCLFIIQVSCFLRPSALDRKIEYNTLDKMKNGNERTQQFPIFSFSMAAFRSAEISCKPKLNKLAHIKCT